MIPFIVNGLVIGSIYGVVALGAVLVYKGSRVINFAHGEMGMLAAFVVFSLWFERGLPFLVAAGAGVLASGAAGFLTERFVIRRSKGASALTILVATLAVAGILQFTAAEIWGVDPKFMPPPFEGTGLSFGQVVLTPPRLIVLIGSALIAGGLFLFFSRTRFGLTFRGAALDPYAAKLSGVNVDLVSAITWTAGAMLSGLAAVLIAPLVSFHIFFMTLLFIRALAAALVAGFTNLGGAFVAGILIGVAESLMTKFTTQAGAVEAAVFALIVVLLAIRPQGLFAAEY